MKKIYIAGKISGECETQELLKKCWKKFEDYGLLLLKETNPISCSLKENFYYSISVENPDFKIGFTHGFIINHELIKSGKGTWEAYMKNDLTHMINCDEIHMLPDWKDSKGAKIEHDLAVRLGIKVIYVLNFDYLTSDV